MAKHLYAPRYAGVLQGIEGMLPQEAEHTHSQILKMAALMEERDQQLEKALLGDLIVNNVSGSVGGVTPPTGKQIGWTVNFGVVSGNTDINGNYQIVYGLPFPTDTVIPLFFSTDQAFWALVAGSPTKTGFTVTNGFPGSINPIHGGYLAVGF